MNKIKNNLSGEMPYNPSDPTIWYNNEKLKEKVEIIRKQFGEPFLITKGGEMLYEHCVVLPSFRGSLDEEFYE